MRETPRQMTGAAGAGTTRRDFLGAAGAAAVVPGITILSAEARGANDRIGVGFIGTGGRAQAHLDIVNGLQEKGMAQPVAVCDVYRPRLEAASRTTGGAKMYMEHEALLADKNVDVVCIATPDRLHAPQAIDALNAGKDVYCEKPLTHWSQFELAKKVQEAADSNRRLVQVGTQHMADDNYPEIIQLIRGRHHRQAGPRHVQLLPPRRLGRADADSRRRRQARPGPALGAIPGRRAEGRLSASRGSSSGGCTGTMPAARPPISWSTPSRPSSACCELGYPERVFGGGGTFEYNREVPDQCNIIADYPGGPSVVMTNSLSNHVPADTIIRGTDGIITWAMLQGGKEYGVRIVPFGKGKKEILLPWKGQGDTSKLWQDLLDCVRTRRQPKCNIAMAVRVQAPLSMGILSHRESKVAKFDSQAQTLIAV